MAGTVIITKHSLSTGSPATDALAVGELAYSFAADRLFIGETSGGDVVARIIGGQLYTDMMDHTAGTLTASSAIIVDANKKINELLVDNISINGNVISSTDTNGNVNVTPNGAGYVVLDGLNYPRADGSANQFLQTDGSGNLSFATVISSLSIGADTGSNDSVNTGEVINFAGGTGVATTVTDNTITIAIGQAVATTSNVQFANTTITGNLTVQGTTTTVNSSVTVLDDPIITLGTSGSSSSDDNKDRGVEFRYNDGSARVGFMGWDDSASGFTMLQSATNSSEVFAGTPAGLHVGTLTLVNDLAVAQGGTGLSAFTGDAVMISNPAGTAMSFIDVSGAQSQYNVIGFNSSGVPIATTTIDGGAF
tara:strand:- start:253 stop:1347 length:1095 start_codon:yes stop_codon:yes gene_type:complete